MDSDEGRIKTNFFDNQAKDISHPGVSLPIKILGGLLIAGVLFGLYQGFLFVINLPKTTAMKNVAVSLYQPLLRDGVAMVDVKIENSNPTKVSAVAFRYTILGPNAAPVATGVVTIPDPVPAGDSRTFPHVKLGALTENAARMQAELVDLNLGPKPNLTAEQENQFSDLAAMQKDNEREQKVEGFEKFVKDVPAFAPGWIELGRSYMATNDYDKAIAAFRQAIKIDAKDGNAHFHLAGALEHNNQRKEAGQELKLALELSPDDSDIQHKVQFWDPAANN